MEVACAVRQVVQSQLLALLTLQHEQLRVLEREQEPQPLLHQLPPEAAPWPPPALRLLAVPAEEPQPVREVPLLQSLEP